MIVIDAGTKPASKKEAFEMAKTLAEGGTLTQQEAHRLYLYFAPKGGKVRTPFEWVASFAAIKDVRYYLQYVYSDGKRIVATNGHILAWHETSEYPEGYYNATTGDRVEGVEAKYPDIDRVIPAISECTQRELLGSLPKQQEAEGSDVLVVKVPAKDGTTTNLLAEYVQKAAAGGDAEAYLPIDNHSPVRGRCNMGEFVIMPRRQQ